MSKQRTLFNVFKPSSSSSTQENDSEGTTAASEGTSGGPPSESRKRKQAPVPDGGDTQIKKSVTSATDKSFRKEWLKEFSWLEEIRTKEGVEMKCKTCVHANEINTFTKGCSDFQKSALKRHSSTKDHIRASNLKASQRMMHEQTEMANERDQSATSVMMRTVYYIAKASKPNSDFGNLIELQALNGCPDLENVGPYHHHSVVTEMEQCIADVISKDIKQAIHASPFVSLLIDETVNVTIHKKLIVFIRYADENGCAKTVFKGNYTVTAGDAETIYNKLVEICDGE